MRLKRFIEQFSKTGEWYVAEDSGKLRRRHPTGDCPQCPVAAVAFEMGHRIWRDSGFYRSAAVLRLATGPAIAMAADNVLESEVHASENLCELRHSLLRSVTLHYHQSLLIKGCSLVVVLTQPLTENIAAGSVQPYESPADPGGCHAGAMNGNP